MDLKTGYYSIKIKEHTYLLYISRIGGEKIDANLKVYRCSKLGFHELIQEKCYNNSPKNYAINLIEKYKLEYENYPEESEDLNGN